MPRTVRRLLTALAIAAGLLLVLLLALPYIVSLDSVRARILAAAESSLHRKVEAGAIRLEIFSGLGFRLEKLTVRNRPGWQTPALASVDRLSVKVAFWPLLSRRVEVKRIVLEGPTVSIERDPKGKLNVGGALEPAPAGGAARSVAALLVSRLQISRGRLLFVDRKVSPKETITIALDDLTGEISDVGPTSAARFDIAGRFLNETLRNLELKGTVGPPDPERGLGQAPLHATFAAKKLALSWLQPYLGTSVNFDPGVFSIDGTAEGAISGVLKLAGNLSLAPPAASSAVPSIEGRFAMQLDWPAGTLEVAKSPLSIAKLPLTAEGKIDGLRATPRLDLEIATPGEVPLDTVTGLPRLAGSLPADVKLSGRARLEASIAGPFADLTTQASVDAAPFSVDRGEEALLAAPAVRATLASRGKEPLTGRITAPSGNFQKLPFENLEADWSWDKGALTLTPALRAFGGALSGRVEADLSHPKSESHVSLDVQGVQAQPLVESLTSMRNVLAGALTAKMSAASRGLTWDDFSKTARGEGRMSLADAELKTVELMPQVASTLAAVGKVAGFDVPSSLQSTRFTTLETALRLEDGRLFTPGLSLSGRDVAATADGSIGFDRSLAYEGRVTLGAAVVRSFGNAGRYLADERGRLSLPFRATGQISAPKVAIEESVVLDLGRRVLARQARDRIQGGAGKILGDVLEGSGGKKTDPLDILQQFLKAPPSPTPTPKPH
jgi:hypothetical protein